MIPGLIEVDTNKLLENGYQLFESVVSKEEQKEETVRLLTQKHTDFAEAYKVLRDHMEESIITEEVLRDCPTCYG